MLQHSCFKRQARKKNANTFDGPLFPCRSQQNTPENSCLSIASSSFRQRTVTIAISCLLRNRFSPRTAMYRFAVYTADLIAADTADLLVYPYIPTAFGSPANVFLDNGAPFSRTSSAKVTNLWASKSEQELCSFGEER